MDEHYLPPLDGHICLCDHEIGFVRDWWCTYYCAHHNANEHTNQNDENDVYNQRHVESDSKTDQSIDPNGDIQDLGYHHYFLETYN